MDINRFLILLCLSFHFVQFLCSSSLYFFVLFFFFVVVIVIIFICRSRFTTLPYGLFWQPFWASWCASTAINNQKSLFTFDADEFEN